MRKLSQKPGFWDLDRVTKTGNKPNTNDSCKTFESWSNIEITSRRLEA